MDVVRYCVVAGLYRDENNVVKVYTNEANRHRRSEGFARLRSEQNQRRERTEDMERLSQSLVVASRDHE